MWPYSPYYSIYNYIIVNINDTVLVFNVGQYRREAVGTKKSYEFFDPNNKDAQDARVWVTW